MCTRRFYHQVEEVIRAYTYMKDLAQETIQFLQNMKNEEPEQRSTYERDENEIRELISQLETEFCNEIIRLQRNTRRTFRRN